MGVMQGASLLATIAVPVLATRSASQRRLVFASSALGIFAAAGLVVAPGDLALLWTLAVGIAGGSTLSLSLAFFVLRTRDGADAAALSGMAQSIGYAFAATGPFAFGALHDATDSWTAPSIVLLIVCGFYPRRGHGGGAAARWLPSRRALGATIGALSRMDWSIFLRKLLLPPGFVVLLGSSTRTSWLTRSPAPICTTTSVASTQASS